MNGIWDLGCSHHHLSLPLVSWPKLSSVNRVQTGVFLLCAITREHWWLVPVKPLLTAVLLVTVWWLGPQLAAAMASDKTRGVAHSQSCLCSKFVCPGEVTIGGQRPSQSYCPSPSGAHTVAGAALEKHTALPKAVQSSHLSLVPSRLVVTQLLARAEGWADALNHRSSNFPGRIRSWQFSGMTVLCSASWPPV